MSFNAPAAVHPAAHLAATVRPQIDGADELLLYLLEKMAALMRDVSEMPPPTQVVMIPPLIVSVARTVVAPPSSVAKCLWGVFVWGFGVLFLLCVCVGVGGVVLCRCVCVTC